MSSFSHFSTTTNIKTHNKASLLHYIRFTPGGISRADFASKMGLSRAAVSTIVNDLLAIGVIHEAAAGPATGGRRSVLREINPECGYVLGVDMGAVAQATSLAFRQIIERAYL